MLSSVFFFLGVNNFKFFSLKNRSKPQSMSSMPRNAAAPIRMLFWSTVLMSAMFVADIITMIRTMNPVNATNPPSAVFRRLFVESVDNVAID